MSGWINSLKPSRLIADVRSIWWSYSHHARFKNFEGCVVSKWYGAEMALNEPSLGSGDKPLIWHHDSVPFLQFGLFLHFCADAKWHSIRTFQNDQAWGIGVTKSVECPLWKQENYVVMDGIEVPSIFRAREVAELPLGKVQSVTVKKFDSVNIAAVTFQINGCFVDILAGEVYEQADGTFSLLFEDESLLVQVDGRRPV